MAFGSRCLRITAYAAAITSILAIIPVAHAQAASAASANASLHIAPALSIRTSGDLVLATILLRAVHSPQSHAAQHATQGISHSDASFVIQGEPDQVVSMAISPGIAMTASDGPSLLFVKTMPIDPGAQLDAQGRLAFRVRGLLNIKQATTPGQYSGLMTATAQYN